MKYSIIIPCYDATEFDFRRCLDSIKAQTIQPYEVICVDDASPTETPKIAIEYGYKYIRHEVNLNNGGARNTGIKEAVGDYNAIKKCMTEEEIKEKYGYLEIMSQQEFKKKKKRG